jgi:hypothetical protein
MISVSGLGAAPHGGVLGAEYRSDMHILSRRAHGALDYIVGLLLIIAPKIFGFDDGGIAARIPVTLGIITIVYSLFTNYELGLFKLLPFRAHLTLDVISGIFLAISPWAFQFADRVWVPHVVVGLIELAAVFMTYSGTSEHHHHHPGAPGSAARM